MNVALTPQQVSWLERKVADGQFGSLEEAAAAAIGDSMMSELVDLAWAKPLVDEARASVTQGELVTLEEFKRFLAEERSKVG